MQPWVSHVPTRSTGGRALLVLGPSDRAAPRDAQYDQFHRCASGCDSDAVELRAVPPPNNGEESYLPSSTPQPSGTSGDASIQSALPLSEECPCISSAGSLRERTRPERLEQQRLEASCSLGPERGTSDRPLKSPRPLASRQSRVFVYTRGATR